MKTIVGIIFAVVIIGGLVWIARPDARGAQPVPAKSSGSLSVEGASAYDFGAISMAAGKVTRTFKIKNTSAEAVRIEKMYTSCMCTIATLAAGGKQFGPYGMPGHEAIERIDQEIGPNEEATVAVVFDPAAHGPAGIGRIQRLVTIENDAGQPIEIQFAATVTP